MSDFLAWMGSSFAARWEKYALLTNNCQHFQSELQAGCGLGAANMSHSMGFPTSCACAKVLLFDKTGDLEGRSTDFFNRALAVENLKQDGMRLKFFPWLGASSPNELVLPRRRYRDDLDLVYEAVRQNGLAVKYASKRLLLGQTSHTIHEIHMKQWKEINVSQELPLSLMLFKCRNVLL